MLQQVTRLSVNVSSCTQNISCLSFLFLWRNNSMFSPATIAKCSLNVQPHNSFICHMRYKVFHLQEPCEGDQPKLDVLPKVTWCISCFIKDSNVDLLNKCARGDIFLILGLQIQKSPFWNYT